MNTQELYAYIDERIEELTIEEKKPTTSELHMMFCVAQKNELHDFKKFIQTNERKLKQ